MRPLARLVQVRPTAQKERKGFFVEVCARLVCLRRAQEKGKRRRKKFVACVCVRASGALTSGRRLELQIALATGSESASSERAGEMQK